MTEEMMEEMKSHTENETWELYELPKHKQVLTNRSLLYKDQS